MAATAPAAGGAPEPAAANVAGRPAVTAAPRGSLTGGLTGLRLGPGGPSLRPGGKPAARAAGPAEPPRGPSSSPAGAEKPSPLEPQGPPPPRESWPPSAPQPESAAAGYGEDPPFGRPWGADGFGDGDDLDDGDYYEDPPPSGSEADSDEEADWGSEAVWHPPVPMTPSIAAGLQAQHDCRGLAEALLGHMAYFDEGWEPAEPLWGGSADPLQAVPACGGGWEYAAIPIPSNRWNDMFLLRRAA